MEGSPALRITAAEGPCIVLFAQQAHHLSLAKVLRAALALAEERRVLLVRERAFAISPTWKEVHKQIDVFARKPNACFMLLEREALARLLAIEHLLGAARSQDLSDDLGDPIPFESAKGWARRVLDFDASSPVEVLLGKAAREEEPLHRTRTEASTSGAAYRELRKLRVASIDRLVREVRACDPTVTRTAVMEELARLPIKRFGSAVVALRDPWQ